VSAEYDTRNTDEPVCPHCGSQVENAWELFIDGSTRAVTNCDACEKEVVIDCYCDVTYSTEKGGAN
jgi:hypothetical protein